MVVFIWQAYFDLEVQDRLVVLSLHKIRGRHRHTLKKQISRFQSKTKRFPFNTLTHLAYK